MRIHSLHCLTPQSKRKNCDLVFKYIYPTFLTEPKKSVIGTRLGSLLQEKVSKIEKKQVKSIFHLNKSVLVPTVDMQTLLGQTFRNSPIVFLEFGVTLSRNSSA